MENGNKYTLHIHMAMDKEPNVEVLWGTIKDTFLQYTKKTREELTVFDVVLERDKYGSIKE